VAISGWLPRAAAAAGPSDAVIATSAGVVPGALLLAAGYWAWSAMTTLESWASKRTLIIPSQGTHELRVGLSP
jgi:hypothetical protein